MSDKTLLDPGLIRQLEQLELVVRRLFAGRMRGEKRSKRRGIGSEFADYRDYVQGDDLRHVDWNIFGRLDRLFLKLFHEEEDLHLAIWIDTSESMSHGRPEKLLYAKKIAAALAIADMVSDEECEQGIVIPPVLNREVGRKVAEATARAAMDSGVAGLKLSNQELLAAIDRNLKVG